MSDLEKILAIASRYEKLGREINDTIWSYAEPSMKEFKSAEYYEKVFTEQGFKVETGICGIPTCFTATWGSGKPVLGFLGEFDSLPGLSQKGGVSVKDPLVPGGHGHGCGHCALGAGAAVAAMILRDYFKENNLPGTVIFYGCPGEEFGSAKTLMARDHVFDVLDAAYTWHPAYKNEVVGYGNLANLCIYFTFKGKTAHAAASPQLGRSALDACELMNIGVNYLREHIVSDARIHYAYVDAGGRAPNIVQDHAVMNYFIRAPKVEEALDIFRRVQNIARGAALMTETEVEIDEYQAMSDYIPNLALDEITQKAYEDIGAPAFDEKDDAIAAAFRTSMTQAERDSYKILFDRRGMPDMLAGKNLCEMVMPYFHESRGSGGSTDVGDVSRSVPTSQIHAATTALGTTDHSWFVTGQSCTSIAHKGLMTAAKVMALSAARAAATPGIFEKAKKELKETVGDYVSPIPETAKPILDY